VARASGVKEDSQILNHSKAGEGRDSAHHRERNDNQTKRAKNSKDNLVSIKDSVCS